MNPTKIHIGGLIEQKLGEKGHNAAWLAERICCKRANVYKIFKKESIDTNLLLKIKSALDTDFFMYYVDNHDEDDTSPTPNKKKE